MYYSVGMGQGSMSSIVSSLVNPIIQGMTPKLKEIALQAAESAKPAMKEVMRETVMPTVGLSLLLGMVAVGILSAGIATHYSTRRNAPRLQYRRRAA